MGIDLIQAKALADALDKVYKELQTISDHLRIQRLQNAQQTEILQAQLNLLSGPEEEETLGRAELVKMEILKDKPAEEAPKP